MNDDGSSIKRTYPIRVLVQPEELTDGYGLRVTLVGLSDAEITRMRDFGRGHFWIRANPDDNSLVIAETFVPPPQIIDDKLRRHWPQPPHTGSQPQLSFPGGEERTTVDSPSITIQSLCGYNRSQDNYALQVRLIQSYGFECLRSPRALDGTYWEIWYLSGLYAAKGDLAVCINQEEQRRQPSASQQIKLERAISFLCEHVQFGTLDVSIQRACMGVD